MNNKLVVALFLGAASARSLTKLAQLNGDGSNAFALMDNNVTIGHLKNLVTDKPAPITLKLA